jgi:hypothetical protein
MRHGRSRCAAARAAEIIKTSAWRAGAWCWCGSRRLAEWRAGCPLRVSTRQPAPPPHHHHALHICAGSSEVFAKKLHLHFFSSHIHFLDLSEFDSRLLSKALSPHQST